MMVKGTHGGWTRKLEALVLLAGAILLSGLAAAQLAPSTDDPTANLLRPNTPHTAAGESATLLPSGQWLLVGGENADHQPMQTAVLLDGRSGKRTALPGLLAFARSGHTATVLPNGTVLILGGEGVDRHLVPTAELFDPKSRTSQLAKGLGLLPRQFHTATLLTDGRLLIVGGLDDKGRVLRDVELLDTSTGSVERFDAGIETARFGHLAALLSSSPVLVWGGLNDDDHPASPAQLFQPGVDSFSALDATTRGHLADPAAAFASPSVTGAHPDPNTQIASDSILALRFSKPLDVTTLTNDTITLFGPSGAMPAKVTPAEAGLLLFVTPEEALSPGAYYTLFVNGGKDTTGLELPFTAVRFQTRVLRAGGGGSALPSTSTSSAQATQAHQIGNQGDVTAPSDDASTDRSHNTSAANTPSIPSTQHANAQAQLQTADGEMWIPGPEALRGDWRSKRIRGVPQLKALSAVEGFLAAPGETAVTGQVLRLNGQPLVNATVSMNGQSTLTDGQGRFILTGVQAGWQKLGVDGSSANRADAKYGRHNMRVHITAGRTNPLVWTVWVPKLDTAHTVHLDSPTQRDTVVSSPYIPGLELRIPAGTVIRDRAGNIVTDLTITPVPIDQTAHPLPEGGFPVYFSLQPSGIRFESADGTVIKPARLRYPNYEASLKPGSPASFWSYDPDGEGWQIYATGTVTPDNFIEMAADDKHGFHEWEDGGHAGGASPPPPGPNCDTCKCTGVGAPDGGSGGGGGGGSGAGGGGGSGGGGGGGSGGGGSGVGFGGAEAGDPVSVTTGQFTLASTDLSVRDVMSFDITRVYRPNDTRSYAFGIGTTWPFGMYVSGGIGLTSHALVMANGTRIYFDNTNNNTGHGGTYVNSTSPGVFFGAVLTVVGATASTPETFTILRKDGTLYTFDGYGRLIEIRSRQGAAITITLDPSGNGNVTAITSPSGRYISISRNGSGFVSQIQDHAGRTVSYGYTNSRLTSVTNANGDVWSYTYDANGRMSTVLDPRHNTMVTNTYDANGRVATQTYADGSTMQFAYTLDTSGNVIQTDVTDRNGSVRRVQISPTGYLQQDTFPLGTAEQQVVTYTNDPTSHLLLSKTDALSRKTDFTYDAKGNVLSVTRLSGTQDAVTTTYTYEPTFNQTSTITDALGHTITLSYDAAGNLTQIADPLGHATTMTYDSIGQQLTVTNALNQTTTFTYDAGVMTSVTDALNRTTHLFSDALGRNTRVIDPLGNQSVASYDPLDRTTSVVNPMGASVAYEYDANGNLTAHVDQKGNRTVYTYDVMNRLIGRQDALLHSESYAYDQSSKLKQHIDRKAQVKGYSYDSLHRLTQRGYGASVGAPTSFTSTVGYTYDAANRATQITDSSGGTITRTYDGLDRLTQEQTLDGTVVYTYDAAGRRSTMTVAGQPAVTYAWDNANRLTSITQGSDVVAFTYDNANRRTSTTLANGVVMSYGYDNADELTSITYAKGATTIGDLAYSYDAGGRLFAVSGSLAATDLPDLMASATVNANNQVTAWGATTLTYDLNGNLTADGSKTYAWDERDRLASISGVATFSYDGTGRRRSKTINGVQTGFVYDGVNAVQELNGTAVLANLITGGVDELFARKEGAASSYPVTDALSSVIGLTDIAGALQTQYSFEPYGRATRTGVADNNSQTYTAREDDGTGLMYYRARYYSPALGRFVTEDPSGIAAGPNAYAYVDGNPAQLVDPLGLAPKEPKHWAQQKRRCSLAERDECAATCKCGVEKCEVNQRFVPVRGKTKPDGTGWMMEWAWKDGPMECSCKDCEPFYERAWKFLTGPNPYGNSNAGGAGGPFPFPVAPLPVP